MIEADIKKRTARLITRLLCRLIYYSGLYFVLKSLFSMNGLYIFFYHNIVDSEHCSGKPISLNSVDKKSLELQLEYFSKEYTVISLDEAYKLFNKDKALDKKYLVVTFDDGYKDNYIYGYDLFIKYKITPTIYLTANNVDTGTYLWPDILKNIVYNSKKEFIVLDVCGIYYSCSLETIRDKIKFLEFITKEVKKLDEENKKKVFAYLSDSLNVDTKSNCDIMLSWDEVKKLSSSGVILGAHTLNHPILANLTQEEAADEIYLSKTLIEERTKLHIEHFAYPNGKLNDINDYCINCVRKYFKTAVTTIPGINKLETDLMKLKRIGLAYDLSIIDLKFKILYFCIIDKLKNRKICLEAGET